MKRKSKAVSVVTASAATIMTVTCNGSVPVTTVRCLWRGARCLTSKVMAISDKRWISAAPSSIHYIVAGFD